MDNDNRPRQAEITAKALAFLVANGYPETMTRSFGAYVVTEYDVGPGRVAHLLYDLGGDLQYLKVDAEPWLAPEGCPQPPTGKARRSLEQVRLNARFDTFERELEHSIQAWGARLCHDLEVRGQRMEERVQERVQAALYRISLKQDAVAAAVKTRDGLP